MIILSLFHTPTREPQNIVLKYQVWGNIIGCLSFGDDIKYASREYVSRIRADIWAKIMCVHAFVHLYTEVNVYTKNQFYFHVLVHDETNL